MEATDRMSEDAIREALGKPGRTFEELVAHLGVEHRRVLSWRLQNMRRAGLVARRGDRWINRERAERSGPRGPRGAQNGRSKLTEADVRKIRKLAEQNLPWTAIAAVVGTSAANCQMIARRKRWAWVS